MKKQTEFEKGDVILIDEACSGAFGANGHYAQILELDWGGKEKNRMYNDNYVAGMEQGYFVKLLATDNLSLISKGKYQGSIY